MFRVRPHPVKGSWWSRRSSEDRQPQLRAEDKDLFRNVATTMIPSRGGPHSNMVPEETHRLRHRGVTSVFVSESSSPSSLFKSAASSSFSLIRKPRGPASNCSGPVGAATRMMKSSAYRMGRRSGHRRTERSSFRVRTARAPISSADVNVFAQPFRLDSASGAATHVRDTVVQHPEGDVAAAREDSPP